MKTILYAAAASLALSAAPAFANQMDQAGHRSVAGYEHAVQAEAGGGNGGPGLRYADASGGEGGGHLRYAEAGGGGGEGGSARDATA
jgi:hypothetical protein